MNADPITVHEIPQKARHDTRRSWWMMRSVVVWLSTIIAAIFGFWGSYTFFGPGNSQAQISEFESSLTDYINAATRSQFVISENEFDDTLQVQLSATDTVLADTFGHKATPELQESSKRLARAFLALSYVNREGAKKKFRQAVAGYATLPGDDQAKANDWVISSRLVTKSLGIAAVSALGAWIAAWLLVVGLALIWWFLTDRLRDISRAVRGE